MSLIVLSICLVVVAILYFRHVNLAMTRVPELAQAFSFHRWTVDKIREAYRKTIESPIDIRKSLPPKQQRRYIVIGGSGLVGGTIVRHLIAKGEEPTAIRILDLKAPCLEFLNQGVTYIKTDITDESSVLHGFSQSWSSSVGKLPLSVFHTAAVISACERYKDFLSLYIKVNVDGTRNCLNAAKKLGASCFVSTSSGSIALRPVSFWVSPWDELPKNILQMINDETKDPDAHEGFFSNYAASKAEAERLVRSANDPKSDFRTGCLRPINAVYGTEGGPDASILGKYIIKGGAPSWIYHVIQNFVSAENVSIAHLLYEQRLIALSEAASLRQPSLLPEIGGQAFIITDPNPPISYADFYLLVETLSVKPTKFPPVHPVPFLILAYVLEWYVLLQHRYLPWLLPKVTGDFYQIQPALFSIADVFLIADDSRARKPPEEGGLGYKAPLTTLEAMCKELEFWNKQFKERS